MRTGVALFFLLLMLVSAIFGFVSMIRGFLKKPSDIPWSTAKRKSHVDPRLTEMRREYVRGFLAMAAFFVFSVLAVWIGE